MKSVLASSEIVGFSGCATFFDNPEINGSHGGNKGLFNTRLIDKTAFTSHLGKINAEVYDLRTRDYTAEEVAALGKEAAGTMKRAAN
ncbi:MAG: hypothetical protein AAGJ79_02790 [Verrucomicrobiota bacterium]